MASGLASLFGYKGGNPLLDGIAGNRSALLGFGAGLAGGGPDFGRAVSSALLGAGQGQGLDEDRAARAKQAADENLITNWVKATHPEYGGLPAAQGFQLSAADVKGTNTAADPSDVATYKFYANQELQAKRTPKSFDEWFRGSKQAPKGSLGTPLPYKDAQGNYHPVQQFTDGSIIDLTTNKPPDASLSYDPFGFASNKAGATAFGTSQGGAQFNLPAAKQNIDLELANIDAIANDQTGLDQTFGNLGGISIGGIGIPNQWTPQIPNTPRADLKARIDQVVGQNFLQAYASLKGAGAITEVEGGKAQDAMARLGSAQSKEAFLKALADLKEVLQLGYNRMGQQAGSQYQGTGYQPPPLQPPSPSGQTDDPELDRALQQYGQ